MDSIKTIFSNESFIANIHYLYKDITAPPLLAVMRAPFLEAAQESGSELALQNNFAFFFCVTMQCSISQRSVTSYNIV